MKITIFVIVSLSLLIYLAMQRPKTGASKAATQAESLPVGQAIGQGLRSFFDAELGKMTAKPEKPASAPADQKSGRQ